VSPARTRTARSAERAHLQHGRPGRELGQEHPSPVVGGQPAQRSERTRRVAARDGDRRPRERLSGDRIDDARAHRARLLRARRGRRVLGRGGTRRGREERQGEHGWNDG
jgi:hypothetical protein